MYYDSFTMDVTTDRNNGTLLLDKNSIATTVSDIAVYSLSDVKAVLDENGDISVNGSFYSSETSEENYMVVLAEYNENGALISVMLFETNNTITVGTNKISFTVTASEGTHIVRPFVWTQDLFPLCNSEETIIIKNVDSND